MLILHIEPDIFAAWEVLALPASKAQQKAVNKYMKANYDEIKIRIPKGEKATIAEHAKSQGESTNAFIYRAVNEAMERDRMTHTSDPENQGDA